MVINSQAMQTINTAAEVIDALGGNTKVSKLFGFFPSAVANWRRKGRFSTATKDVLIFELERRGLTAPPELWRMRRGR